MNHGPFAPVFAAGDLPVPGYLCLLHAANPAESAVASRRIEDALQDPGAASALADLLAGGNWRSDLVAAVALLVIDDAKPFLPALWAAVRRGSWVTPQLLATASVRDPDFGAIAAAWCSEPALPPAKSLSALLALADPAWGARTRSDPRVAAALIGDVDDGGALATDWLEALGRVSK